MTQRVTLQPGFILHSHHYGDSSLIVEAFSQDYGRINLLAKGYRKKRPNALQPYCPLLLSWSGRGELKTIIAVETNGPQPGLQGNQLFAAFYLNEILQRLLPKFDAHPQLFHYYQGLLSALAATADFEPLLRQFELTLLRELGYALDLTSDANDGTAIQAHSAYRYLPEHGFLKVAESEKSTEGIFVGSDLLAIAANQLNTLDIRRAAKRLTRLALSPLLGNKPLKSRELFKQTTIN